MNEQMNEYAKERTMIIGWNLNEAHGEEEQHRFEILVRLLAAMALIWQRGRKGRKGRRKGHRNSSFSFRFCDYFELRHFN
jgi:hypothetical protein